jgi:Predicted membrane protein (DUF2142)
VVAYSALTIAWAIGNPPFAAPDEPDHYVRAVGLIGGQLIGRPVSPYPTSSASPAFHRLFQLYNRETHLMRIPARLWASGLTCNAFNEDLTAGCQNGVKPIPQPSEQTTLVSGYTVMPYVVPGVLARLAHDPLTADRLARLGCAALCLCLFALAVSLLWERDPTAISLVGLIVAVTPMVLFTASILNPSGLEILSSIAFLAALLRLTRRLGSGRLVWVAAGVSGVALALSRTTGPAWVVFDCLAIIGLTGLGRTRAIVAHSRRSALSATAIVVAAMVSTVVWQEVYGPPSSIHAHDFVDALRPTISALPSKFTQVVGVFGWLDAPMPALSVLAWQALAAALITAGFLVGGIRARRALVAVIAASLAVSIVFGAWFRALAGIESSQGRHLLPIVAAIPLMAGEIIYRNRARLRMLRAEGLFAPVACVCGFLQVVGWWANARRQSHGVNGKVIFLESPAWSPPLGWVFWTAVVLASFLMIVTAAVMSWKRSKGTA